MGERGEVAFTLVIEDCVILATSFYWTRLDAEESVTEEWSREKLADFTETVLKRLKVTEWKEMYYTSLLPIPGGGGWSLLIKFADAWEFSSGGELSSRGCPDNIYEFQELLREYFPRLLKLRFYGEPPLVF